MRLIYTILIGAQIVLGMGHCAFTFKKYHKIDANALWFFSASLGIIFNGLLNFIALNVSSTLVWKTTMIANVFQFLFFSVLAYHIRKPTTFVAFTLAVLLLIISFLF